MKKLDTDGWLQKAKNWHGSKYDYSQVVYRGADEEVTIVCPAHGEFRQRATRHLAYGCPKCGVESSAKMRAIGVEGVRARLAKVSGPKLSFPKLEQEYTDTRGRVTVLCSDHGEFTARVSSLLKGQDCPACGALKPVEPRRASLESFVTKAREIHGDKYDYSEAVYLGSSEKLTVICKSHGGFSVTPGNHLHRRSGCPVCARGVVGAASRDSIETFVVKARAVHGDAYDYSESVYSGSVNKIKIRCPDHGVFEVVASYHIHSGVGCPTCKAEAGGQGVKLTTAGFIRRAQEAHGDLYDYSLSEYTGSHADVTIICRKHGPFRQSPTNHLRGSGCGACADELNGVNQRKSTEQFIAEARAKHGDFLDYSEVVYVTNLVPVTITCPEHGAFQQTPAGHLKGEGCPQCAAGVGAARRRVPFSEFLARAREAHGLTYSYAREGYTSGSGLVTVTCPTHGKFDQKVHDHYRGYGCPACASHYNALRWSNGSIGQLAVASYVESLGVRVLHNHRFSGRREVDIFIPDHNLAIEYHGTWFHSSKYKRSRFHQEKFEECQREGVRLVQIFSDEWQNKEHVVRSVLANMLGATKRGKGARSYSITYVSSADARKVYESHHMLGAPVAGGDHIALVDSDGSILSLMTMSRSMGVRGSTLEADKRELIRFVNPGSVTGAATRLFTRYVKDHPAVTDIVSFSDNRWYSGAMYQTLGFTREEDLAPDYTYVASGSSTRVHKSRMQKERLAKRLGDAFDPNLSERENCERAGFYQVFDAGKIRWRWVRTRA